jgi:hypothetical protein
MAMYMEVGIHEARRYDYGKSVSKPTIKKSERQRLWVGVWATTYSCRWQKNGYVVMLFIVALKWLYTNLKTLL